MVSDRPAGKGRTYVTLSYTIQLLLHVPLLQVVVEGIKCIFTLNVGKQECVGVLCLEEEMVKFLRLSPATLFQNFLGFKAATVS